jgi:hypothetical protein
MRRWPPRSQEFLAGCAAVVFFMSTPPRGTGEIPMTSEQNPQTTAPTTRMVIERFNEAFNRHDADALEPLLTDDTVFEDTSPAPDGQRIEGKAAVVAFWRVWFTRNADAMFEAEDVIRQRKPPSQRFRWCESIGRGQVVSDDLSAR